MKRFIDWLVQYKKLIFALLILGFTLALTGRLIITKSVIGGDAVYYYSTIRAFVIGHKLDLKDELYHYYDERSGFTGKRKLESLPQPSATGVIPINYPVGAPVMLVPFFFIAHIVSILLGFIHHSIVPDGYGFIYYFITGIGSMLYGAAAMGILYWLGLKKYPEDVVFPSVILICLATPVVYYMTMEPLLSHTVSVFSITLFFTVWYLFKDEMKWNHWLLLGILGGIAGITRYQDGVLMIIPPIYAFIRFIQTRKLKELHIPGGMIYAVAFLAVYFIQLYINKVDYGSFFTTCYGAHNEGFIYWNRPKILYELFSPYCGLFTRSPILIFSFIGLFFFYQKDKITAILLFLFFLIQLYLISSWWVPFQGDTFGNRMLQNSTFMYAIGLMEFFNRIKDNKKLFNFSASAAIAFVLINLTLIPLFCFRIIGNAYAKVIK